MEIIFLIYRNTYKWVLVEYFDEDKTLKKAYFADGTYWFNTLRLFFNKTERIYESMKS